MDKVLVQVPVRKDIKELAEKAAYEQGFSSLQESLRIFMHQLGNNQIGLQVSQKEDVIKLSPKAIKRYNKISDDFKKGRNIFIADNVEDFLKQLHENSVP